MIFFIKSILPKAWKKLCIFPSRCKMEIGFKINIFCSTNLKVRIHYLQSENTERYEGGKTLGRIRLQGSVNRTIGCPGIPHLSISRIFWSDAVYLILFGINSFKCVLNDRICFAHVQTIRLTPIKIPFYLFSSVLKWRSLLA